MTETTRPWRVACIIGGFPDHSSALRFEFFTKTSHTKIDGTGLNALQRRASLITAAEKKMVPTVRQNFTFYLPDPYFRECVEVARDKMGPLVRMFKKQCELTVPEWHDQQGNVLSAKKKTKQEKEKICFVIVYSSFDSTLSSCPLSTTKRHSRGRTGSTF